MINLKKQYFLYTLLLLISLFPADSHAKATQTEAEKIFHAVEINGVLCGYSEMNISTVVKDGKEMTLEQSRVFMMLSALGMKFNTEIKTQSYIDPATGKSSDVNVDIEQGQVKVGIKVVVKNNVAHYTPITGGEPREIKLAQDVIFGDEQLFRRLVKDFTPPKIQKKKYKILMVMEGEIQESTFTKAGEEKLELVGKTYDAIVLDHLNHKTGLKIKWWADKKTSLMLKANLPNGRSLYLTDHSVVDKIKIADMDESIIARVNVPIADYQAISYMKVKATIEPIGLWVTQESLNVPGQSFKGNIKDNLVEGVFEMEYKRYDGSDAPPFPPDFSKDKSLKKYLEPEKMIESGDPVLIKKAEEITKGSKDSWEAACRLSKWVADNISYAIPGGGTARKTYDIKAGECGAHSILLAAFCRGVGIPARVVWGCMYTPNYGGSFGQHGWSEIYMGEVGWIPVDSTAFETDYVDSGHIRLGVYQYVSTALNPKKMEVLDYKAGSAKMGQTQDAEPDKFKQYVGKYTNPDTKTRLKVFVQGGNLAVDIPDKMILAFNEPDKDRIWYCKISNQLFLTFEEDGSGKVTEMQLHQIVPLPRKSGPEKVDRNVPEKFRPYLGKYSFAALQADFTVLYKDGSLAVDDPTEKKIVKLKPPDQKGRWVDEFNKNTIFFDLDDRGNVKSMNIDAVSKFRR
ncbi:MAG: transglutaminase-like domain-containing protein [Planctomycetota bacterium]|jgi:transglutaminase-like putative cysteine protease